MLQGQQKERFSGYYIYIPVVVQIVGISSKLCGQHIRKALHVMLVYKVEWRLQYTLHCATRTDTYSASNLFTVLSMWISLISILIPCTCHVVESTGLPPTLYNSSGIAPFGYPTLISEWKSGQQI